MRALPVILSAFLFLAFSVPAIAGEKIRMGYFMLQPHTYSEIKDGPAKGAGIAYFNKVAEKMGYEVEWVGPLPLPRLTEYLKSGKVDGTIGFPKFSLFEQFLDYTDSAVYMAQPSLAVSADRSLSSIGKIGDIKDFRIGFVKSKSGKTTPLIDNNRKAIHLREFHGNKWMEQSIRMVQKQRLDALYDRQQYTMRYVAAQLKLEDKIRVLPMPAKPSPMYIAFSKKSSKGAKKLVDASNAAVSKIKADYVALLEKEFSALKK
ncbi:MAG: substrate-binding periplasmic protein [Methyloligellaceae bacterium]